MVADDRYAARDALELIDVEYEPLPAVMDARRALDPDAPVVRDDLGTSNHIFDWETGDAARDRRDLRHRRRDHRRGPAVPAGAPGPAGDLRGRGRLRRHLRQADRLVHQPGAAPAPAAVRDGVRVARTQDPGHLARHRRRLRQQGPDLPGLPVRDRGLDGHRPPGQVDRGPLREPDEHVVRPRLPHARGDRRDPGRQDPGRPGPRAGRPRRVQRCRPAEQVPGRFLRRVHRLVRPAGRALPGDRGVHQQGAGRRGLLLLVPHHRGRVPGRADGRHAGLRAGPGPGRAADEEPAAARPVSLHLRHRLGLRLRRLPQDPAAGPGQGRLRGPAPGTSRTPGHAAS